MQRAADAARRVLQHFDAARADTARRKIHDAHKAGVVLRVLQQAQVGQRTLDLGTLKLRLHSFGETAVPAGAGQLPYFTEVDLRPDQNLLVRIEADLLGDTLTWRFTSIDPATGEIPEDPLDGFLPPNRNGVEGQGYVYFTVEPKSSLQVGDVIANKATIVFDANAPIDTPTWTNTVWNGPAQGLYLPLVQR